MTDSLPATAARTAQRYPAGFAHLRMEDGKCPECGGLPSIHADQGHFWDPWMQTCSLYRRGVEERIERYRRDRDGN